MISEKDLRVMKERSKDFERAADNFRAAREAQAKASRTRSKRSLARLMALFL